jgi:hypothetical protein
VIGWSSFVPIGVRPGATLRGSGMPGRTAYRKRNINCAIDGYADDMLSALVYSVERDLEHESEADSAP